MARASVVLCFLSLVAVTHARPLKIYILAGQSNMQGHGNLSTVPYMGDDPRTRPLHDKIVDQDGKPRVHERVRIAAFSEAGGRGGPSAAKKKHGPLTMGYGSNLGSDSVCGPELAFGITVSEMLGEPVLLIKTAWGGKSLNTDFRPPSAGRYELPKKIKELWAKHPQGAHGIPSEKDRPKWRRDKDAKTGYYYRLMISCVKEVLDDITRVCPDYDPEQGYEIAGLVWFQGWNDMCDGQTYPDNNKPGAYAEYTRLMAHFIRDVRTDLDAPDMRFVIGVIGVGGDKATGGIANLRPAMAAPAEMDEFKGTVAAVETGEFWDYEMEALQGKKSEAHHLLRAAYVITDEGVREKNTTGKPGWEPIGKPAFEDRTWRFISIDPENAEDRMDKKDKKRFREINLPVGLEKWYEPGFDDSEWKSGKAPVGKGTWKHRQWPEVKYNSNWGDGEFLLMRTAFTLDDSDYAAYRLSVLARQGFQVYLNGHKIHTYIWWKDEPFYRPIRLEATHTRHLKKGRNVLAVYANAEFAKKTGAPFGVVDLMLEGATQEALDYVTSEEYALSKMDRVCTRREGKIIRGSSNAGYHYLGSAKMLGQIGKAFAEAMLGMDGE